MSVENAKLKADLRRSKAMLESARSEGMAAGERLNELSIYETETGLLKDEVEAVRRDCGQLVQLVRFDHSVDALGCEGRMQFENSERLIPELTSMQSHYMLMAAEIFDCSGAESEQAFSKKDLFLNGGLNCRLSPPLLRQFAEVQVQVAVKEFALRASCTAGGVQRVLEHHSSMSQRSFQFVHIASNDHVARLFGCRHSAQLRSTPTFVNYGMIMGA